MRITLHILVSTILLTAAFDVAAQAAEQSLEVEIQSPKSGFTIEDGSTSYRAR